MCIRDRGITVISEPIAAWTTKTIKGISDIGHVDYEWFVGMSSDLLADINIMRRYGLVTEGRVVAFGGGGGFINVTL